MADYSEKVTIPKVTKEVVHLQFNSEVIPARSVAEKLSRDLNKKLRGVSLVFPVWILLGFVGGVYTALKYPDFFK